MFRSLTVATQAEKGIKKSSDTLTKSLGMQLDLLRSDHMLAGRWFVDDVIADSPIAKAGIQVKDVLMKIAKTDIISEKPSLEKDVESKLKDLVKVFVFLSIPVVHEIFTKRNFVVPFFSQLGTVDLQFYREHMGGFLKLDVPVVFPKP